MGFFGFRRRFRLLPGVYLNVGKRSISISLGARGMGFTLGPKGRSATVGIPGSGLSYTLRSPNNETSPPPLEVNDMVGWAQKQSRPFHFELPLKEPSEPPASSEQIGRICQIANSFRGLDFSSLGQKQATALISALEAEREQFTQEKAHEYFRMIQERSERQKALKGCGRTMFLLILLVLAGIACCINLRLS